MKLLLSFLILASSTSLFAKEKMSYIEYSLRKAELAKFKNLENYKKNTKKKKSNTAIISTGNHKIVQKVSTKKAANNNIFGTLKQPTLKKIGSDLSFSYYAKFLGPSLGGDYQSGATYNRFNTGQDYKGDDLDATGSYQTFHALTIGYQVSQNIKAYYGYSIQEELNNGIKYKSENLDGTFSEFERGKGPSDNNKRVGFLFFNTINNDYVNLSLNTFYEFPSTFGSESQDMDFGLGIAPTLSFKSNVAGLSYGISAEIQRNFFQRQEFFSRFDDGTFSIIPTKHQTLLVNLTPYLNYVISDIMTFKSSLQFDWDQRGNEVNNFEVFNKNLDDIAKIGMGFNLGSGISTGLHLDIALEDIGLERTAISADILFNIF